MLLSRRIRALAELVMGVSSACLIWVSARALGLAWPRSQDKSRGNRMERHIRKPRGPVQQGMLLTPNKFHLNMAC